VTLLGKSSSTSATRGGRASDDHLIEAVEVIASWIAAPGSASPTSASTGVPAASGQHRQGLVDDGLRLARVLVLWVDDLVQAVRRPRHEQREPGGTSLPRSRTASEQGLRCGRLVRHNEHAGRDLGGLHLGTPFCRAGCPDHVTRARRVQR